MRTILSLLTFLIALAGAPAFGQNAFRFYGRAISSSAPSNGQAFIWNSTTKRYELGTVATSAALSALTTAGLIAIVTSAGTLGQDTTLAWDTSNKRLSIGSGATTTHKLNIATGFNLDGIMISGSQDNIGINFNSTGTGGRGYAIFSTAGSSGAGAGRFTIWDNNLGLHRAMFWVSGLSVVGGVGSIPVAVASLPAAPQEGMTASVNNATATTIGSTVAGGGSNKVLVWYNGSIWKIFAN